MGCSHDSQNDQQARRTPAKSLLSTQQANPIAFYSRWLPSPCWPENQFLEKQRTRTLPYTNNLNNAFGKKMIKKKVRNIYACINNNYPRNLDVPVIDANIYAFLTGFYELHIFRVFGALNIAAKTCRAVFRHANDI